ncbi:MAG: globin [Ectothiorhodospiraceae bacterium]|nr:globin [Ectothiorhodospiraceae bacterium]
MSDSYNDVVQSYGRCLRDKGFIDRFYQILMSRDSEIRAAFSGTDFGRQRRALRRGISTALMFAAGNDFVREGVDAMAEVHSRRGRAPVEPRLYALWLDSLVDAIAETESRFNPQLEQRWREAMSVVIRYFSERYN